METSTEASAGREPGKVRAGTLNSLKIPPELPTETLPIEEVRLDGIDIR